MTGAPAPSAGLLARHAFWITALACLLVMLARDPGAALAPPVLVEDALIMLSHYHAAPDPREIFRFYEGYISLGPNLVGYLTGQMPLSWTIYLLHWVPLVMAAAAFAAPQIRGVALFGMRAEDKLVLGLMLALVPFGNWALLTNTTYMLWHMLVFATVLILFWTPRPGPGATALFALLVIFSWSHPLFVLLVPALAVRLALARDRFSRTGFAVVLAATLAYLMLGIDIGQRSQPVDSGGMAQTVTDSLRLFLARGVFEPVFSTRIRTSLAARDLGVVALAFGALLCAVALAGLWRLRQALDRRQTVQLAALLLYAGLFTAASVAAGKAMFDTSYSQRYTYPTAFLLLITAVWMALTALRGQSGRLRALALGGVAVWLIGVNVLDARFYRTNPADGAALQAARTHVAVQSEAGAGYCTHLDRGKWSVTLRHDWPQALPCLDTPLTRSGR